MCLHAFWISWMTSVAVCAQRQRTRQCCKLYYFCKHFACNGWHRWRFALSAKGCATTLIHTVLGWILYCMDDFGGDLRSALKISKIMQSILFVHAFCFSWMISVAVCAQSSWMDKCCNPHGFWIHIMSHEGHQWRGDCLFHFLSIQMLPSILLYLCSWGIY